MKLRFKMLLGFSVLILIIIGIVIYILFFLSSVNTEITELVDTKFEIDKIIQQSNITAMTIHSEIWDAFLFGEGAREVKKSEIAGYARAVYDDIRAMKELMPAKEELFNQLKTFYQAYIQLGYSILDFNSIDDFYINSTVVDSFKSNKIELISIFSEITTFSTKEFSDALLGLKTNFEFTNLLMAILSVVVLLLGVIISFIISSTLTKPIYNLVDVMKEIEKDNYDVEAKITTKDEIGKLATTFNTMTKQIKLSRENLKDQERLKKEMEIAERIQTCLLPVLPDHDELQIAASMTPSEEVGGDYYDLIIDDSNNLWMAVGDVSGHGVTPGLVMMMAETAFNGYVVEKGDTGTPKDAIVSVNRILTENIRSRLKEKHFMTMNFLKYMGKGKFLQSGSHVDIIVYRHKTKTCDIFPTDGVYMGIVPDISSHTTDKSFILDIGDVLVLYTDGVIESRHKDNVDNLLGMQAVIDVINKNGSNDANTILEAVKEEAMAWCGYKPDDDITMVVAKRVK
jgi:serine phosphatase RsbU (regulator of sigma subunit)